MLKVGDKVKIKSNLVLGESYGNNSFILDMEDYKGKIVTINEIRGEFYYIEEDEHKWGWTLEMFTKDSIKKAEEKSKFKVGDKVQIKISSNKDDLESSMNGLIGIIRKQNGDGKYHTFGVEFEKKNKLFHNLGGLCEDGYGYNISTYNLIKYEEPKIDVEDSSNVDMKELASAINKLAKEVKREDPFKKAMIEGIIEKGKELATEDLKKEIKLDLDKFIKDTYGDLPRKIQIEINGEKRVVEGLLHKEFEKICKIVEKNVPLMLIGPAGTGKNFTLEQVAEALGLEFYFTNAITQEYKLTGFIDANGIYQETQFYKAFKDGGLFFLDEVDASVPEALIILNSAIANGYFDFPNGRVNAHKDFRVVCAGNTYGTGADMVYVGRNVLDGATLDRFAVVEFNYDEDIEKQLAYDEELYKFIKNLRDVIAKASLRYIVSMRATINSTKLLQIGLDKKDILKSAIVKNMQVDDLNVIIGNIDSSNEWAKELKEYTRGLNDRV